MANAFTFRPAVREETSIMLGFAGPSGSGKTLSALRAARGLAGGDDTKIFAIDTEQGRMLHYACALNEKPGPYKFRFNHLRLNAPFSPDAYMGAIAAARGAGAKVIIVDSMSHEHEGQGGILEWHEQELKKMAGDDWAKRERVKFTAWIVPKAAHNKLVNSILQQPCHMIFCFRAKDKLALVKNDKGKIEPVKVGWTAICSDRFEYEMTCLLMLPPNAKGVPDLAAEQTKLQEQHRTFFPAGKPITEKCGEMLAAWAKGGIAVEQKAPPPPETPPHDPDTGEIDPGFPPSDDIGPEPELPQQPPPQIDEGKRAEGWANRAIGTLDKIETAELVDSWMSHNKQPLARCRAANPDAAMSVVGAAESRRRALTQEMPA